MTSPAEALRARLKSDPQTDLRSLRTETDRTLSIGRDVWRLRWREQVATAVAGDADLATTCGALLDALAVRETVLDEVAPPPGAQTVDASRVNVLIDRPLPGKEPSEVDQAMRSLRDSVHGHGVFAHIWYQRGDDEGWADDMAPAPTWMPEDPLISRWVQTLLLPRLTAQPTALAAAIVAAVGDPSLHLFPSEISDAVPDRWALRIDGLEIGVIGAQTGTLTVGKPGKSGDGPQRQAFTKVFGQPSVTVSLIDQTLPEALSVAEAAELIRALLRRFRPADVPGAPIAHRFSGGRPVVDEHTMEARLLKGLIAPDVMQAGLVLGDGRVARGSQFPTLWGHNAQARYLDALLCRGTTPLAVELKVARGGQGRYYRRALAQAVLYRHFIRSTPPLDPWFDHARLERQAVAAAVGIPIPRRWTPDFTQKLQLLRRVAAMVDVEVHVLDDRATPEWDIHSALPEPRDTELELLTWRLAAALSRRWPMSFGRVVESRPLYGFYDMIQLQHQKDARLNPPWTQPLVSMNRPGSLRVLAQSGSERWVWRGIWNHLANGGDPEQAAAIVGAIAGLPEAERHSGPSFAEMAVTFLSIVADDSWSWRNGWQDDHVPEWVDRYGSVLHRYRRRSTGDVLPTIGRVWGATRHGQAEVIVDQQSLRTWVWDGAQPLEMLAGDPLRRIAEGASLLGYTIEDQGR